MRFNNACSLGPQNEEDAHNQNWHRMDCLARWYIEKFDRQAALKWFGTQDQAWQDSRKQRFNSRINERRW